MEKLLRSAALAGLVGWGSLGQDARAQLSPRIDLSFQPQDFYQPAAGVVVQASDGSRLLLGAPRVEQRDVPSLARLRPSGQFDAAFAANVAAYSWQPQAVVETVGNKLLVLLAGPATVGGTPAQTLVRLLPDGTRDASFQAPTLGMTPFTLLPLPDGRVLLGGRGTPGAGVASSPLLRLNTNGTLDPAFYPAIQGASGPLTINRLLRQPDGKLLITGNFTKIDGVSRPSLARLSAEGALDASFAALANASLPLALALQPDGKVLYSGFNQLVDESFLQRLLPTGLPDASFSAGDVAAYSTSYPGGATIAVRADGRIYVVYASPSSFSFNQSPHPKVVRLLPTGATDPNWKLPTLNEGEGASHLQLLADGQVLVSGPPAVYSSQAVAPTAVVQLDSAGYYVPGFAPLLHQPGVVADLAQQADGKLLVAGKFTFAHGRPVLGLARLHLSGELDTAFVRQSRLTGAQFSGAQRVLVQPDGKILVTGSFTWAGGALRKGVARLLPTGSADASFDSPFQAPPPFFLSNLADYGAAGSGPLAVQPDGKLLVPGTLGVVNYTAKPCWRLNANGQVDTSFQPTLPAYTQINDLLALPNGKLLLAISGSTDNLQQLLPTGAADASFTRTTATNGGSFSRLVRYPDGRLLVGGSFTTFQGHPTTMLARVQDTGVVDATFAAPFGAVGTPVVSLALQPNGRVLLSTYQAGLASLRRVQATGAADADFLPVAFSSYSLALLVQADGALLAGGLFQTLLGQNNLGLVRLLADHVLAVSGPTASLATEAWPVPAHGALHLRLDAASRPRQVQLLDALGRVALAQPAPGPGPDLTLDTAALPPGTYLLRVEYQAGGTFVRRVVLE